MSPTGEGCKCLLSGGQQQKGEAEWPGVRVASESKKPWTEGLSLSSLTTLVEARVIQKWKKSRLHFRSLNSTAFRGQAAARTWGWSYFWRGPEQKALPLSWAVGSWQGEEAEWKSTGYWVRPGGGSLRCLPSPHKETSRGDQRILVRGLGRGGVVRKAPGLEMEGCETVWQARGPVSIREGDALECRRQLSPAACWINTLYVPVIGPQKSWVGFWSGVRLLTCQITPGEIVTSE